MDISPQLVKELREKTGAGMMDCKKALVDSVGDMEKAIVFLRKKGLASAEKKAARIAAEGMIGHYIHSGSKLGVLVEVNCETDFAARSDDFTSFVKDIAMHIAAANPQFVRREEVPAESLEKEKEIYRDKARASGKPEAIVEKIVTGQLENYYKVILTRFTDNGGAVTEVTEDVIIRGSELQKALVELKNQDGINYLL